MKKNKNIFCAAPFTSITIFPDGGVRPCCLDMPISKEDGSYYNINRDSLDDIWNSKYLTDLRENAMKNKYPEICSKCLDLNDAYSPCSVVNFRFKIIFGKDPNISLFKNGNFNYKKPKILELRATNICNLKCRICNPDFSDGRAREEVENKKKYLKSSPDSVILNSDFWRQDFFDDLRFINFLGGEPLLFSGYLGLLKKIIKDKRSSKTILQYSTNGTIFPSDELIGVWQKFKKVRIALSIDDIEKRFEYQRFPAKWDEVKNNIINLLNLPTKNAAIIFKVDITVSIFNVYYLSELLEFINKINSLGNKQKLLIFFHFCRGGFFDIRLMKNEQKEKIINKYSKAILNFKAGDDRDIIKTTLDFMGEDLWNKNKEERIKNEIRKYDKIRNQSFRDVFPELNKILSVYRNKKILFYTANGVGLGHIRRSSLIAKAVRDNYLESDVFFVSLCSSVSFLDDLGFDFIKLRPINDELLKNYKKLKFFKDRNEKIMEKTLNDFRPDTMIFDIHVAVNYSFPYVVFDSKFNHINKVLIYRLTNKKTFVKNLEDHKKLFSIMKKVIIPHTKEEVRAVIGEKNFLKISDKKFIFSGPIIRDIDNDLLRKCEDKYKIKPSDFTLTVALGGGGELLSGKCESPLNIILSFMKIYPKLKKEINNLKVNLVLGPLFKHKKIFNAIKVGFGDIHVEIYEKALLELFSLSDLVISPIGYNAGNEILSAKTPAILTPLLRGEGNSNEQMERARYLERFGVVKIYDGKKSLEKLIFESLRDHDKMRNSFKNILDRPRGNDLAAKTIIEL